MIHYIVITYYLLPMLFNCTEIKNEMLTIYYLVCPQQFIFNDSKIKTNNFKYKIIHLKLILKL